MVHENENNSSDSSGDSGDDCGGGGSGGSGGSDDLWKDLGFHETALHAQPLVPRSTE